jgi:hypothetical protein
MYSLLHFVLEFGCSVNVTMIWRRSIGVMLTVNETANVCVEYSYAYTEIA